MMKKMSVEKYKTLTNFDKKEIEKLFFETLKEEVENLFPFLKVEKVVFGNYWERLDEDAESWKELSGYILSNGKTFIRLPDVSDFIGSGQSKIEYSSTIYETQSNILEFFGLPNTVIGITLAWGDDGGYDYF